MHVSMYVYVHVYVCIHIHTFFFRWYLVLENKITHLLRLLSNTNMKKWPYSYQHKLQ